MRIDIHCHAVGKGKDIDAVKKQVYFNIDDDPSWLYRRFYHFLYNDILERNLVKMGGDTQGHDGVISTDEYFDLVYNLLVDAKEIDGIVLLAFDAVFEKNGELNITATDLWVSNQFLSKKINELNARLEKEHVVGKKFYFGASVNPNRKDWEEELDFILKEKAVLMKWIPSAQHIRLDEVPNAFYEKLGNAKIPLLSHLTTEHTFPEGFRMRKKELDHFRLLENPLCNGVKVIGAHCNAPSIPLIEKDEITEFIQFMEKMNKSETCLFADTSGLCSIAKSRYLSRISRDFNHDWLVHGSDFPIPVNGWLNIPFFNDNISVSEYKKIIECQNPFDQDVLIKRAHGFDDAILHRLGDILRLP